MAPATRGAAHGCREDADRMRTAVLVNVAMVVEQANEQVLPSVYLFVGRSLNATPSQLGAVTLCRALVQTMASPLSGVLGDRYNRITVIAAGAFIWAVMTSGMALSATLRQAMLCAAVNGLGLALLVPCCQSLVADLFSARSRGQAFGVMQLTGALGGMAGGIFATNIGAQMPYGMDGWRFAFHCIAGLSFAMGVTTLLLAVDPRRRAGGAGTAYMPLPGNDSASTHWLDGSMSSGASRHDADTSGEAASALDHHRHGASDMLGQSHRRVGSPDAHAWNAVDQPFLDKGAKVAHHGPPLPGHVVTVHSRRDGAIAGSSLSDAHLQAGDGVLDDCSGKRKSRGLLGDICWMLRIPTFQAIVLQGIVGCFPWQAMVFFTLWLQLEGFSNATASLLVATFQSGVALGALLGGTIGDLAARRSPDHGRIFAAQFSVASGIPLTLLLLKALPASPLAGVAAVYGATMFTCGLLCSWAGAGCNSPIFAELVPDDMRSTIYAFDRSFENSFAACAAPVVGLLAEHVFGFRGSLNEESMSDVKLRAKNAGALGSSLATCMVVPWSLCLLFYTVLHFTYPSDRQRAQRRSGVPTTVLPGVLDLQGAA